RIDREARDSIFSLLRCKSAALDLADKLFTFCKIARESEQKMMLGPIPIDPGPNALHNIPIPDHDKRSVEYSIAS
ncbi:MAG: hypothetical protein ACRERS_04200, partial [Methylococcales bacterium]